MGLSKSGAPGMEVISVCRITFGGWHGKSFLTSAVAALSLWLGLSGLNRNDEKQLLLRYIRSVAYPSQACEHSAAARSNSSKDECPTTKVSYRKATHGAGSAMVY